VLGKIHYWGVKQGGTPPIAVESIILVPKPRSENLNNKCQEKTKSRGPAECRMQGLVETTGGGKA